MSHATKPIADDERISLTDWDEHPAARAEALEAVQRYLEDGNKLGAAKFRAARLATLDFILTWPASPAVDKNVPADPPVQSFTMGKKWKRRIVYQQRKNGLVWILAYAPTDREPGYWVERLDDLSPGEKTQSNAT